MKKFTHPGNFLESSVVHLRVFLAFVLLFTVNLIVNAQCPLAGEDLVPIFVGKDCEISINYQTLLSDDGASCSTVENEYHISIFEPDKTTLIAEDDGRVII